MGNRKRENRIEYKVNGEYIKRMENKKSIRFYYWKNGGRNNVKIYDECKGT